MIFLFYIYQTTNASPLPCSMTCPFCSVAFFFYFSSCPCTCVHWCIRCTHSDEARVDDRRLPRAPSTLTHRALVFVLRYTCDYLLPAPTVVWVEGGDPNRRPAEYKAAVVPESTSNRTRSQPKTVDDPESGSFASPKFKRDLFTLSPFVVVCEFQFVITSNISYVNSFVC